MNHRRSITKLSITASPLQVAAAWPVHRPLCMLHSGRSHPRWSRWSVLAEPVGFYRFDGRSHWTGCTPLMFDVDFSHDPLHDLDAITAATGTHADSTLPFVGGWIGYFSYDLGRWIEPAAAGRTGPADDRSWPLIELAYCPWALVFDNLTGQWHAVGDVALDALLRAQDQNDHAFNTGPISISVNPDEYLTMVSNTIDYIAAGDIFQANITQRLSAPFDGSTRALCQSAMAISKAWYGAYVELPDGRCILSLSPELFLDVDFIGRSVITRPIKGTR
ncbi:MAG: chorismate-binding protein, partial [Phycisphaerales bacterium]